MRDAALSIANLVLEAVVHAAKVSSNLIRAFLLSTRIQISADIQVALVTDKALDQAVVLLTALLAGDFAIFTIVMSKVAVEALAARSFSTVTVARAELIDDLPRLFAQSLLTAHQALLARPAAVADLPLLHSENLLTAPVLANSRILTGQSLAALLEAKCPLLADSLAVAESSRSTLTAGKLFRDVAGPSDRLVALLADRDRKAGVVLCRALHVAAAVDVLGTSVAIRANRETAFVVADGDAETADGGVDLAVSVGCAGGVLRGESTVSVKAVVGELTGAGVVRTDRTGNKVTVAVGVKAYTVRIGKGNCTKENNKNRFRKH